MTDFKIRLSGVKDENHEYFFDIDSKFFETFKHSEVTNCLIKTVVGYKKDRNNIKITLDFKGEIYNLLCDLCADEITISIDNSISVILHETEEELEHTDEIIYIKPNQHELDISQLIFEGIVLHIPFKREHSGDQNDSCEKEMMVLMEKYTEKKDKKNDPRWEELNKLKDLI